MRLVVTVSLLAALAAGCTPSPAELIPPGERALATVGQGTPGAAPLSVDSMLDQVRTQGATAPVPPLELRFVPGAAELAAGEPQRLEARGRQKAASIMAAGTTQDGSTADAALALRRARAVAQALGLTPAEVELGFDPGLGPDKARIVWAGEAS